MERIPEIIHESWHEHLQKLFDDPKMNLIRDNLLAGCKFYPEANKIFRVFKMPLDKVKVVVLGQDPYFNGSAIGLAFAVKVTAKVPVSLEIIMREIEREGLKSGTFSSDIPVWKTLEHWEEQGVFLLNTALTVEIGKAGSHLGQWMWFTREIIKILSEQVKPVWMLWGSKAQSFEGYIANKYIVKTIEIEDNLISLLDLSLTPDNYILEAPHPAAGSYNGGKITFQGCNHFTVCNKILELKKQTIINW